MFAHACVVALSLPLWLADPATDAAGVDGLQAAHRETSDQPQFKPIGPRQVRPPLPPEFLTVNGFTSVQVNVDENGDNIVDDAANEPSIAVDPLDPSRIAIGWRQFDTIESGFRQAGWGYSEDGGATWTFPGVLERDVFRSDPVLGFDSRGTFYYYSLKSDACCDMFISDDGGMTWPVMNPAFGGDKQWFTVDRTPGIGQGNIYAAWSVFFDCDNLNRIFTRSTDEGFTFSDPILLPGTVSSWPTLTVGPDGALYIAGRSLEVVKSVNAQDPDAVPEFEVAGRVHLDGEFIAGGGPNGQGLVGQVWIDADHSDGPGRGHLYVLSSVKPAGVDPLDVMVSRSRDGGVTWDDSVRVNDDPPADESWQWFGTMSVAPTGRIDAIFNDTRNTGVENLSEVFYAYSIDGGQIWSKNVAISPVFDSHIGRASGQHKMGDYDHMISAEGGAHLAYAATFNGEQDVYYVYISPDCNQNGIHDGNDIQGGQSADCNANGVPDECEPDEDCNENGMRDLCEPDCNGNDVPDDCDIRNGTSQDCNDNRRPDDCEPDCNENGVADECDIRDKTSEDCNGNGVPDECERLDGFFVHFFGTGARMIVPDFEGFPDEEITVSLWLNNRRPTGSGAVLSYAVPGQDDEFLIQERGATLALEINGMSIDTGIRTQDREWHHIALVWASEDGVFRSYLDGFPHSSGVVAPGHRLRPGGTVVLADEQDEVGGGFDSEEAFLGRIDELRVWRIARSGSDIWADMNRRLSGDEQGLVGYWRFDEGERLVAYDQAGRNDGTLRSILWFARVGDEVCHCARQPAWICDGDVDGDGQVNPVDSGLVQAAFCSGEHCSIDVLCQYDIDCDGQINPIDLGIIQSLFGSCEKPRGACR